jgi:hypothetical protein
MMQQWHSIHGNSTVHGTQAGDGILSQHYLIISAFVFQFFIIYSIIQG